MHLRLPFAIALGLLLTACGSNDNNTPRATPTATVRTPTGTPRTPTATATEPVGTATSTPPATSTVVSTATHTVLAQTATATATPQATDTAVQETATATHTAPPTATSTGAATATDTVAATPTDTVSSTATATPAASDTATPSPTPTATQLLSVHILEPANGSTITTVAFTIRAAIDPPDAEVVSVGADLNGTAIALSAGTAAGEYVTEIGPDDALQEDNILTVTAIPAGSTAAVSNTVGFRYLPPQAVARRITDAADLITGPLADGRIGDWLLANGVARFIIQDAPQRNLYSVGAFGGNIIDAELVGHPGLDNFLEIQPAVQIETVINAQTVEIVNDGSDGRPASIRTCGPDDVLDFVNPSTIIEDIGGLPFPASADDADYDVEGCTEYSLAPGARAVKMVTTLYNNEDVDRGFYVGDYINAAGQVEQWTSAAAGLGEILTSDLSVMSFIGYGEAAGVDYAHVTLPIPGSTHPGSSFFTASGVSYVMQSNSVIGVVLGGPPTFFVPAHGSNSFTRYLAVGDGSGSNAVDFERAIKGLPVGALRGCVTIGGVPAPQARVAVGPVANGAITSVTSIFVTGPDGCYAGTLPPGAYGVAAARQGAPYEGGGSKPIVHPIAIAEGGAVEQNIALPATGRVRVQVTDADEQPLPARVAVVGFDPSPEVVFPGSDTTGLFYDQNEALRFGFVYVGYTDSSGRAEFEVEPGDYQLAVSRGTEYSLFTQPLVVAAGGAPVEVAARIARVLDTSGFVSSDFHVHGIASADSRVPESDRVRQFAGEGVDNIIMTDHHAHTDLTPTIARLGFTPFVHATIGEEITTWDYGHYNAYPLLVDPTLPNGGSTDWAVAAPPGKDFRSLGAYSLNLPDLQVLAETGPNTTPDTVVQINHIDSTFDPLQIDTKQVPPRSFIGAADLTRFRLDPNSGNQFAHFKALELWNGSGRGKQSEFLDTRLGIWFNHLNQGLRTTGIGDTDTHEFLPLNSAGARTWTASPTDDPAAIDPADVARAVAAGRAVFGQGVYVQSRLRADDGSDAVADLTLGGSVDVRSENGTVLLDVEAQAPLWAPFDRIEIYANADTVVARERGGIPTLYGAEPTLVLTAGVDVPLDREVVDARVPGAERWVSRFTLPFPLQADTWFVVIVKGTDGVSPPMFPVFGQDLRRATNTTLAELTDGNLGEAGTLALGVTNALYADVDGEPGFNPPRTP
ncbi:hypothetical protein KF840_23655 [bacterium]|nr:hypothetical protein [bacterium]